MREIETKRLRLASMQPSDAAALFDYRSRPDVYHYQSWFPKDIQEAAAFISTYSKDDPPDSGQWRQFGIYLKETNQLIGDCGFCRTDEEQTEIGYTISPDFQKQGFGAETVRGLVNYLCDEFGVHRITASTDPDNTPSIALLKKIGFRKEGYFRKSIKIRDEWKDDVLFAIRCTE